MSELGEAPERSGAAEVALTSFAGAVAVRWSAFVDATGRFGSDFVDEIRQDRWLYACVLLYTCTAWLLATSVGSGELYQPFLYVQAWLRAASTVLIPGIFVAAAINAAIDQPRAPLSSFPRELRRAFHPRIIAGLMLFCATVMFYGTFTCMKNLLPQLSEFTWDPVLADIDQVLHGGHDPVTLMVGAINSTITLGIDFAYGRAWILVLLGISLWAATTKRHAHLRVRFFMTYYLCWSFIGNVLAGLFLSGGPTYYGFLTGDADRFAGVRQSLEGTESLIYQDYLWQLYTDSTIGLGTGISAFPSMHLSVGTFLTLYLWSVDRRLGLLGALFTAVIMVGSVRLGWHYAIDGYVSIILTILIWYGVDYACRRGWFGARAKGA